MLDPDPLLTTATNTTTTTTAAEWFGDGRHKAEEGYSIPSYRGGYTLYNYTQQKGTMIHYGKWKSTGTNRTYSSRTHTTVDMDFKQKIPLPILT